jgi:hypothetical protein
MINFPEADFFVVIIIMSLAGRQLTIGTPSAVFKIEISPILLASIFRKSAYSMGYPFIIMNGWLSGLKTEGQLTSLITPELSFFSEPPPVPAGGCARPVNKTRKLPKVNKHLIK